MRKYPRKAAPKRRTFYRKATASRTKKGRTGGKRRARTDTMRKHSAPVSKGTSVRKGKSGPGGVGYSMSQVSDTCTRITGRAYIGEIRTNGKVGTGQANCVGLMFDINPVLLNDRVAVIASTYEKYVYHGVKFTYVPQCSTATAGSVGLVFDRDPLQYAANTQGSQFLAEVMSYEHAVLTPAYVSASTAYTRDPKELKTWFLGSPDATLSTRETSQGNFLAYISNGVADTGYGFIVMDYVLDLVAPNLLPNKQGVTDITSAPSQWRDFHGTQSQSTTGFQTLGQAMPVGTGTSKYPIWAPNALWLAAIGTNLKPGVIGEYVFGGLVAAGSGPIPAPAFFGADNQPVTIKHGQKLYFCVHIYNIDASVADVWGLTFHTTLSSARASAGTYMNNSSAANTIPDALFGAAASTTVEIGGWLRLINDGTGVTNTA